MGNRHVLVDDELHLKLGIKALKNRTTIKEEANKAIRKTFDMEERKKNAE